MIHTKKSCILLLRIWDWRLYLFRSLAAAKLLFPSFESITTLGALKDVEVFVGWGQARYSDIGSLGW